MDVEPDKDLPPELVAQVLDYLADDRPALLMCSSLSWSWRQEALSLIFRVIQIPYHAGTTSPLTLNAEDFYGIQKHAPHLLIHLRHLIIWTHTPFNYGPNAEMRFLRNVSLPRNYPLTTLTIGSSLDGDWSDGLIDDLGARLPALRRLEVDIRGFLPLHDLAKALSGAHELVLHAPSPSCRSTLEYDSPSLSSDTALVIPQLHSLELVNTTRQVNERSFAQVARIHARAPNLQRVSVKGVSHRILECFFAASRPFKESIHELTLRTAHALTQAHLDAILQHCPNLRILEIGVKQDSSSKAPVQLPAPSSPAAARLETVRLVYSGFSKLRPDIRPPDAWDALGAQINSVSLSFIVADGREEEWRDRIEALVKEFLPKTYSSRKLFWGVEHE